jgi:DNA repair protein RecO (recombination protein O)
MALERVEGVVIRTRDLGEADRVVTLYTREKGKLTAVAKGARRPRNRFASLAQVPVYGKFALFQGRGLGTLSQGELITSFKSVRADLTRTAYAMFLAELYDHMMEEGEPAPDLFSLLLSTLHVIDQPQSIDLETLFASFQLKFLALMGYGLQLDRCVRCGDDRESTPHVSPRLGGLICEACLPEAADAVHVSAGIVQIMRRLFKADYRVLASLRVSQRDQRVIKRIIRDSLEFQLSRPLKSLDFLESMISEEPS